MADGQQGDNHIEHERTGEGETGTGGVHRVGWQLLDNGAARQHEACVYLEPGPLSATDRGTTGQGCRDVYPHWQANHHQQGVYL